jgi:hypothetical protein
MSFNTTQLVNQIALKAALPDQRYTDQEILDLAYDVLITEVQPQIVNLREEYYVKHKLHTVTANQQAYLMPDRALGQKLREVKLRVGSQVKDLPRISIEDVQSTNTGSVTAFYLESNYVYLYQTPASTGDTLDLSYYLQASGLVPSTDAARITGIDRATGVVTAACPATWTTSDTFDLTSAKNSGENLALDLTASAVSGTDITFAVADIPSGLAVGDYVTLANETYIVPVPDSAKAWFVSLVAAELLGAMGSLNEQQAMQVKAEQQRGQMVPLLVNRVSGAPKRFGPQI